MTIANARFLYNNLVDSATITADTIKTGYVTSSLKDGTGSAVLTSSGVFTGQTDLEYTVEIDDVSGGAEVTQSTYRWKTSATATGSWEATGVTTSSTTTVLSNGVNIQFASGSGDDFVAGDIWYFKGINRWSVNKLHDYDRDTFYRSTTTSATLVFDFGSAQTFDSVTIHDHNLSASATVTLEANATDSWGAPSFSQSITYNNEKIIQFFASQSYRYARLVVVNTGNTDGYIQIRNVFIGEYMELSKTFDQSHSRDFIMDMSTEQTAYGIIRDRFRGKRRSFNCQFSHLLDADITKIEAMLNTIADTNTERLQGLWFIPDPNIVTEFWLMRLAEFPSSILYSIGSLRYHNVSMSMTELAKSV